MRLAAVNTLFSLLLFVTLVGGFSQNNTSQQVIQIASALDSATNVSLLSAQIAKLCLNEDCGSKLWLLAEVTEAAAGKVFLKINDVDTSD
jgi:hypothetical protein